MGVPRHWRLKAQSFRLEGSTCPTYGQLSFLSRPVCPRCTAQPVHVADYGLVVIPLSNRIFDTDSSNSSKKRGVR